MNTEPVPLTIKPGGPYICLCVKTHSPRPSILHSHHVWPLGEGGPNVKENLLWLCPTTHMNVHELWRVMDKLKGDVSPAQLPGYSRYVWAVVRRGWGLKTGALISRREAR